MLMGNRIHTICKRKTLITRVPLPPHCHTSIEFYVALLGKGQPKIQHQREHVT